MKKSLLLLAGVAMLGTVSAQEIYKQEAGNKNLEVQFAPLGGTPVSIGGLRFRSFMSETSAFRLNFFVGGNTKTTILQQAEDTITKGFKKNELKEKESTLSFSLRPGFEKHFSGTDRLSPYVGAELEFGMTFHKLRTESEQQQGVHIKPAVSNDGATPTIYTKTEKGKKGYMTVGVNLVSGADYYFTKKAYLGVELGLGFGMKKDSKIKVTDEDAKAAREYDIAVANENGVTPPKAYEDPTDQTQGGTVSFGPTVTGQIRLGFLF